MYYLYHIPGKKIGVTSNLNTRVTLIQGYKEGEYEVLESSEDIDYISDREIELQKSYGYKVDRRKYSELYNKSNNMKIIATEQTSTFPYPISELKKALNKHNGMIWETQFGTFKLTDSSIKWILSHAQVSMYNPNRSYIYNKAFYEAWYNKDHNPDAEKCVTNNMDCERFDLIRTWAAERGIYDSGHKHTQYVKLQEEAGELAKALLEDDKPEIQDAIGDIVVVLTNLAHLEGLSIEDCIDAAYAEIVGRTGSMVNGTFVKDK